MKAKMKILIGYDGSGCADAALDDLQRAGLPAEGVEALVLAVAEVWLPPPPPSVYEIVEAAHEQQTPSDLQKWYGHSSESVREAEELAARAGARLRAKFPAWEVMTEGLYGSPARELMMRADQWRPDLVVVGSHGRTALGRFIMGSVSQKVLAEARTSVRVARGRVEVEPSPVRVVVGVDGSPGAEAAVRAVAARRWPLKSEARVVIVQDQLVPTLVGQIVPSVAKWTEEANESETGWVHNIAGRSMQLLSSAELSVSASVRTGDPKRMLVEEAEAWGADCIFVGSMGFSNRVERFLIGSVSSAVAARAHCSVEVVRAPKEQED